VQAPHDNNAGHGSPLSTPPGEIVVANALDVDVVFCCNAVDNFATSLVVDGKALLGVATALAVTAEPPVAIATVVDAGTVLLVGVATLAVTVGGLNCVVAGEVANVGAVALAVVVPCWP